MRRFLVLLAAAAVAAALLATAPVARAASATPLEEVSITGVPGAKPTVSFASPFAVKASVSEVREDGSGSEAENGSQVLLDYVLLNGRTGEEIETSYGVNPVTLVLDKAALPALRKSLLGTSPGSRVVVAIAPKDGLNAAGATSGVKKSDTLVFVFDVKDVTTPLTRATGTKVPPVAGLPTVKLAKSGQPTITMPKGDAPSQLVVQPLIEGDGPVVEAGQTVDVHYTGAIWDGGRVFDSSWKRGKSTQFPIGTGGVITGWDEGLVGQTVGSQVLLVIPPDKGYGTGGNASAGIKGTDTLVFVVDILGAA